MYVEQLTAEQIHILMSIFSPNHSDLSYQQENQYIRVNLRDETGIEDNYLMSDYEVQIIDWMAHNEHDYIVKYRKQMLEWFGEQYAIDYLLA